MQMNMNISRLPNLIIAGVGKAGTTSLFGYLSAHPDICPADIKEVRYFAPLRFGATELAPIETYSHHFAHCRGSRYILEASPGYYHVGKAGIQIIRQTIPDARIIIIFREPVGRLFSFFTYCKSHLMLDPRLTFEEYVNRCERMPAEELHRWENRAYWGLAECFYADNISHWFDIFGNDAIMVLFFEHLRENPLGVLVDVCKWLEIESEQYLNTLDGSVENKTVNFRSRAVQRITLAINRTGETFWRKHPQLKKRLRRLYYSLNSQPVQDALTEEIRAYLDARLRPNNQRLAVELARRGYVSLPEWLARELPRSVDAPIERSTTR
jgi:hypothetical protein